MNKWNIPNWMEKEIILRDTVCVYCGVKFQKDKNNRKSSPSWEHIVNDAKIVSLNNICLSCVSCNASKGSKDLLIWFDSNYCKKKNINVRTVSEVVRKAILNPPTLRENRAQN
jgi:5-methylcytosine-specific restriction endonuclease McrA